MAPMRANDSIFRQCSGLSAPGLEALSFGPGLNVGGGEGGRGLSHVYDRTIVRGGENLAI